MIYLYLSEIPFKDLLKYSEHLRIIFLEELMTPPANYIFERLLISYEKSFRGRNMRRDLILPIESKPSQNIGRFFTRQKF